MVHSHLTAEEQLFEANLNEFKVKVGLLVSLESGGKMDPEETFKEIKSLYKKLKKSHKNLIKDNDEVNT